MKLKLRFSQNFLDIKNLLIFFIHNKKKLDRCLVSTDAYNGMSAADFPYSHCLFYMKIFKKCIFMIKELRNLKTCNFVGNTQFKKLQNPSLLITVQPLNCDNLRITTQSFGLHFLLYIISNKNLSKASGKILLCDILSLLSHRP